LKNLFSIKPVLKHPYFYICTEDKIEYGGISMKRRKELIEIVKTMYAKGKEESISEQFLVLIYELGDLAKCIANMIWYPEDRPPYRAEAKKAIADIITQLRITCEYLDISFEEMDRLGFLALKEKAEEYRKRGMKKER